MEDYLKIILRAWFLEERVEKESDSFGAKIKHRCEINIGAH